MQKNDCQMKIEFSAPGKTILSGEHSVVYNKNALVLAIDLRTKCTLSIFSKISN